MERKRTRDDSYTCSTPRKRQRLSDSAFGKKCKQLRKEIISKEESSPRVAVVVGYKRPRIKELTPSLKKIISIGTRLAIAKSAVRNPSLQKHIIMTVAQEISKEIKNISSRKHDSILRMKTNNLWNSFHGIVFGLRSKISVQFCECY
jgi:hypothetical protein